MEYAIVDIETTGGYAAGHGMTEIAIQIHNGVSVQNVFETLINPEQDIPLYITALTGIGNDLVRHAPTFREVAKQIHELLVGRVFVAHNVNFDYSFIKHHLAACGYLWDAPKLCTVRLSRKLLPGYPSYSLGKLCQRLDIPIHQRHRAGGDVTATRILFEKLLVQDNGMIAAMLKKSSKEQALPANLPREEFEQLPQTAGVYYFKNQKGKVIYVGKARNIKKRVGTHFSGQNPNQQRQNFLRHIHHISYTCCGTELMALLLEATEIKRLWPENNRALKRFEPKYGLYTYEDQNGYHRLAINKHQKFQKACLSFTHISDAYNQVSKLLHKHQLCAKLCGLQQTKPGCLDQQQGNCHGACIGIEPASVYNLRVSEALSTLSSSLPSFYLIDQGRTMSERSCIWVEEGRLYGMGYLDIDVIESGPNVIKKQLTLYPSSHYMMQLIMHYIEKHPHHVTWLHGI